MLIRYPDFMMPFSRWIPILNVMTASIVVAILFFKPALVEAGPNSSRPRKRDEVRVVITFANKLSAAERQSLHISLRTNFLRHFATTNSDLVRTRVGHTITKAEARKRGDAICARYLQAPIVKACVPAL